MITEIGLRNFKCFEEQRVRLSAFNLLSGLNGMGKSTLLQTLLLLRQSFQQGLLPDTGLALNGDLVAVGTAQDALFKGAREDVIGFTLGWDDGMTANWTFAYNRKADVLSPISVPEINVYSRSVFGDECIYLSAERIGPRTSFGVSEFSVRQHRQLGSHGEFAVDFLNEFGDEQVPEILQHPRALSGSLRDQVEAWMSEFSPGTRLHFNPHREMDLVGLQYSVLGENLTSEPVRPTNFGFGITYVLPVLTATLAARQGSTLLIENPEAHLHPRGQVIMGDLLTRAAAGGVQVIVETHSDHVLNGTRIAVHRGIIEPEMVWLHYFQRPRGSATTTLESPRIDRNGRIDVWPDGFFDEWSKSLDELLEPAV
jgi:predicted ATPase